MEGALASSTPIPASLHGDDREPDFDGFRWPLTPDEDAEDEIAEYGPARQLLG
jgi:hypothetical protein